MKKLLKIVSIFLITPLFLSCEEEEPFICDKNAVVELSERECAFARVTRTSGGEDFTRVEIGIGWSTGGLELDINSDLPIEEKIYTREDGANFWFNQLNRLDFIQIEITKIDKENKTISGTFTARAEGNSNSQAYEYSASGQFTDVFY